MATGILRRGSHFVSIIQKRILFLYVLTTIVFLLCIIKYEIYSDVCNSLMAHQRQIIDTSNQIESVLSVPASVPVPYDLEEGDDALNINSIVNYNGDHNQLSSNCGNFDSIQRLYTKDPKVLSYIRCKHLFPPSTLPYDIDFRSERSQVEPILQNIFKRAMKGFFLDIGAYDGQFRSNTLSLELFKEWTGLLIESNPKLFPNLKQRNRRAWIGDMCVSPHREVAGMHFLSPKDDILRSDPVGSGHGKLLLPDDLNLLPRENFDDIGVVECFPLPSIMTAVNVSHVNFLSLNVQGAELKVLKNLPYDKSLQIDIILLEYTYVPEGMRAIQSFLESKNYFIIYESTTQFIYALNL